MLNLGIPYPLYAGVVALVCALVGVIGILAKWRSENIKIAMLIANAVLLFALVLIVPKLNLVMKTKLPADIQYIHQDNPIDVLSKQFKQLDPLDQELLQQHLVRTFETTFPRGKTFGEAIEIEKAYAQQVETVLVDKLTALSEELTALDPDQQLRNTFKQGLVVELLSREVLGEPTTIMTRYQVTNRSDTTINGLTMGVRITDRQTGVDLIQPSYCYVSHYQRLQPTSVVDFECETKQVAPEIAQVFVEGSSRFELSPVLRFVQLTNGRDLMFD